MALLKVVSVRDSALDAFSRPFCVPTLGAAQRSFQDECNNKDSPVYAHPKDYELFCIGDFEETTGLLTPCVPVSVCRAADLTRWEGVE